MLRMLLAGGHYLHLLQFSSSAAFSSTCGIHARLFQQAKGMRMSTPRPNILRPLDHRPIFVVYLSNCLDSRGLVLRWKFKRLRSWSPWLFYALRLPRMPSGLWKGLATMKTRLDCTKRTPGTTVMCHIGI